MKKALIDDSTGKVLNIIAVPDGEWKPAAGYLVADVGPGATAGAIYSNGKFSKSPEQVAEEAAKEAERIAGLPAEINAERRRRIDQGTAVTVAVDRTFTIQTRPEDIANITALSLAALLRKTAGLTTPFIFRDANNVDRELTPDEMITMGEQALAHLDAVYKKSWAIKDHSDLAKFAIADDKHW